MIEIARELATVLRDAMKDWGTALRLCLILAVIAGLAIAVQLL